MEKYKQLSSLGSGGFGSVYFVKRKTDGELFALKEITLIDSKVTKEDVDLEKESYLRLDHPNIVKYVDHFILKCDYNVTKYCIVIEYCDGGSLQQIIKDKKEAGGRFSELQILRWCLQVTGALIYLQHRGMIHRDIKPANLLLKNGYLKLADFGVVKILSGGLDTYSQTLSTKGTPRYWPPECYEYGMATVNSKWDVWALGCVVHEVATLEPTFQGSGLAGMMNAVMTRPPQPIPRKYRYLHKIVDGALKKNALERSTAEDIKVAVETAINALELQMEESLFSISVQNTPGVSQPIDRNANDRLEQLETNVADLVTSVKSMQLKIDSHQQKIQFIIQNQDKIIKRLENWNESASKQISADSESAIDSLNSKIDALAKLYHSDQVAISSLNQKFEKMTSTFLNPKVMNTNALVQDSSPKSTGSSQDASLSEVMKKMRPLLQQLKQSKSMSNRVQNAFLSVDRTKFTKNPNAAYGDVRDGCLWRPSWSVAVVNILDQLLKDGSKVLIMSSYPGYEAAILGQLVGESGRIIVQEYDDNGTIGVKETIQDAQPHLIQQGRIIFEEGNLNSPCGTNGPYDAIIDRFLRINTLDRNVYARYLVPYGIAVCRTSKGKWAAMRKMPNGKIEDIDIRLPAHD